MYIFGVPAFCSLLTSENPRFASVLSVVTILPHHPDEKKALCPNYLYKKNFRTAIALKKKIADDPN